MRQRISSSETHASARNRCRRSAGGGRDETGRSPRLLDDRPYQTEREKDPDAHGQERSEVGRTTARADGRREEHTTDTYLSIHQSFEERRLPEHAGETSGKRPKRATDGSVELADEVHRTLGCAVRNLGHDRIEAVEFRVGGRSPRSGRGRPGTPCRRRGSCPWPPRGRSWRVASARQRGERGGRR